MPSDEKIPSYPVVHVTIQPDGSAHVNVAGKHVDYPATGVEVTRAQVIAYATDVAARLGRGVRMTTVDPDGEWKLGVYPDGEVVDLAPATAKGRGAAKKTVQKPRPTVQVIEPPAAPAPAASLAETHTVVIDRVPDATTPRAAVPRPVRPKTPGTPVATLTFSTGDTAVIGPHAIIGRQPASSATDPAGAQLVVINDKERTVSRVHCEVGWVDSTLVVTDRASGNGTYLTRRGTTKNRLEPGKPYELQGEDWLGIGTDVTCRVTIGILEDRGTR